LRVAHLSDLHYGPRHLEEADRCFSAAVDRAIELAVDVAVISGDATDHALDLHAPRHCGCWRRCGGWPIIARC
jgi:exonuclease SbcD